MNSEDTDLGLGAIEEGMPVYGRDGEKVGTVKQLRGQESEGQVIPDTGQAAEGAPGLTSTDPGYLGVGGQAFTGGMAGNATPYSYGTSELEASVPSAGDPLRSSGGRYVQVDRGGLLGVIEPDLYIPLSEVQRVTSTGLYLTVDADQVGNEGWSHKPDWID